jgi:hypothetical protein
MLLKNGFSLFRVEEVKGNFEEYAVHSELIYVDVNVKIGYNKRNGNNKFLLRNLNCDNEKYSRWKG